MEETGGPSLVKLLALAGIAFVGYRYVYLPWKFQQIINQQALAAGMSSSAFVARLGAAACQGLGAAYGIPPQATGGVCGLVGGALAQAPSWLASLGSAAASSTAEAGAALGGAIPAIAGGAASGIKSLTDAGAYGLRQSGSLVADGARSVAAGLKYASVEPVKLVAGAVGSAAGSIAKVFGGGSSKLGRASNGKDVFPNDMANCAKLGHASSVEDCGSLYNLATRKWPWE